jgi:hypothetical protein
VSQAWLRPPYFRIWKMATINQYPYVGVVTILPSCSL